MQLAYQGLNVVVGGMLHAMNGPFLWRLRGVLVARFMFSQCWSRCCAAVGRHSACARTGGCVWMILCRGVFVLGQAQCIMGHVPPSLSYPARCTCFAQSYALACLSLCSPLRCLLQSFRGQARERTCMFRWCVALSACCASTLLRQCANVGGC